MSRIISAVKAGLKLLQKPEPLRLSEWLDEHFYLSAESSYIEGKWETMPYQVAIADAMSNDDIREVNWIKSARVGATKLMVGATGYFAEHKKRNCVFFQPVDQDAKDFVKDEINPMLRDVPQVRRIFPDYDKKSQNNTLEKKVFLGSTLDVRGGKAAKNYRRLSKDVVFYDELDAFDNDVDNEGDPVTLGDKRIECATFPKSIRCTTPKIKGQSLIEHYSEDAECYFRFFVPCPHCHKEQYLKFGGKDASFGLKWEDGKPRTTQYLCEHCGCLIDFSDLPKMQDEGVWRDEKNGVWIDDNSDFHNADGDLIDPPYSVTFHLWTAYSSMTTWQRIVEDFLRAKNDPNKLKTFVNTTLGETWDETQGDKVDPDSLYARREEYVRPVPEDVLYLTIGADTQDDRVEWEVFGWGPFEERYSIAYYRMYGDPASADFWADVYKEMTKDYRSQGDVLMSAGLICIDSGGHYTDEVYKFSKRFGPQRILPIKGANVPGKPIVTMPRKRNDKGVYLCEVGTDTAKELLYHRMKQREVGAGYCHYPLVGDYDLEYFRQATAEVKIKKFRKGKPYFEWHLPSGMRNEVLDCSVYGLAAVRLGQQYFGWSLVAPEDQTEESKQDNVSQPSDWLGDVGEWF